MQSDDQSITAGATGVEISFVRRALVEGGATFTVFADGSYTSWVPRAGSGGVHPPA